MKVLEIYTDFLPRKGGVATYIYDLSKALIENGHKPVVLAWDPPTPTTEVIDNITVHRFKMPTQLGRLRYIRLLYTALKIRSTLKSSNIDIIHAHDYFPGLACAFATKFSKTPLITTFHLPIDKTSWIATSTKNPILIAIEQKLKEYLVNKVSIITCVSKYTYKETLKLGFPATKLSVINNWFTPITANTSNGDFLKNLKIGKDGFILSVGRLDEKQKRFSTLIQAQKLLLNRGLDLNLIIVGTGPSKQYYQDLINKSQLREHTHLLGNLKDEDLAYLYDKCKVFALSSSFEGLPLVVLEAMSHDKPVVATQIGGVTELIKQGYNGVLVDLTVESIADGIQKILRNPQLATLYAKRSHDLINTKYSKSNRKKIIETLENAKACT